MRAGVMRVDRGVDGFPDGVAERGWGFHSPGPVRVGRSSSAAGLFAMGGGSGRALARWCRVRARGRGRGPRRPPVRRPRARGCRRRGVVASSTARGRRRPGPGRSAAGCCPASGTAPGRGAARSGFPSRASRRGRAAVVPPSSRTGRIGGCGGANRRSRSRLECGPVRRATRARAAHFPPQWLVTCGSGGSPRSVHAAGLTEPHGRNRLPRYTPFGVPGARDSVCDGVRSGYLRQIRHDFLAPAWREGG